MTTATRTTHEEREAAVMADLQTSFPNFADGSLWTKVPDGEDPPDFLADTSLGRVGLELVEWLDGAQMGPAQRRRGDGKKFLNLLTEGWETKYQPSQLSSAVISPKPGTKVASRDETALRQEFWRCAEAIDRTWITNRQRIGDILIRCSPDMLNTSSFEAGRRAGNGMVTAGSILKRMAAPTIKTT
jgi:hypothetical protein